MTAHVVYRCFDAADRLLYVGCTGNLARRMSAHRNRSATASRWLQVSMARHEVSGPFASREAALKVEAAAIAVEQPLFNIQKRGVPHWQHIGPVAAYLIQRGHLDLALETACGCWGETKRAGEFDPWCVPHTELAAEERAA